jgi:hypothetical protein
MKNCQLLKVVLSGLTQKHTDVTIHNHFSFKNNYLL